MATHSASMARNYIRKSLKAINDPYPTESEKNLLWEYFENKCIYCNRKLVREERNGHLDHIIPSTDGGSNSIYNCVLACSICNGDEKREINWKDFLKEKCQNGNDLKDKISKIEYWMNKDTKKRKEIEDEEIIIKEVLSKFDSAINKLKQYKEKT